MDRKVVIVIFILLNSFLVRASCLVEFTKDKQIFLKGNGYQYIVVLPSDEANKKIKKYYLKNSKSSLVKLTTEQNSFSENSTGDIIKFVRESQKPIVILAEEKSSADVLEAFLQYPSLKDKVKCFFSINGYIRGADYAELAKEPFNSFDLQQATKMGFIQSFRLLIDFTASFFFNMDWVKYSFHPKVRTIYLSAHDKEIFDLVQSIQFYSIDQSHKEYGDLPYSKRLSY